MTFAQGWMLALTGCMLLTAGCAGMDRRAVTEQLNLAQNAVAAAESKNAKVFSPEDLRHAQDALAIAQDAFHTRAWKQAWTFARKSWLYARIALAQAGQKLSEERLQTLQQSPASARSGETPAAEGKP